MGYSCFEVKDFSTMSDSNQTLLVFVTTKASPFFVLRFAMSIIMVVGTTEHKTE